MAASSSDPKPLLSLAQAARRLGVHPATLRRWADQGDLQVVLTPGGHRRFPHTEIERLAARSHTAADAPLEKRWADEALSHTRAEIAEHQDAQWLTTLDEDERARKRELGRHLMGLMMQYIAAEEGGEALLEEAHAIGRQYAESTRAAGLSLQDALKATMFFRDNIVESALLLPQAARMQPEHNKRLLRRINSFLNTIQLAIAEGYK